MLFSSPTESKATRKINQLCLWQIGPGSPKGEETDGWGREKNFVSTVDFMLIAFYHNKNY